MAKILKTVLFLLGFGICFYPLASSVIEQHFLKNTVTTYEKSLEEHKSWDLEAEEEAVNKYNRILFQSKDEVIENGSIQLLDSKGYENTLNLTGTGIMGSIEIPQIDVNLPIYHGTTDEVLSKGIGHVEGTSFPVGGENTRVVLSGHRGLPNSKLFTRLDELEEGDLFFLKVLGKTLAYQVSEIEVIEPENVEKLAIAEGKDLVTLVTCTPYGLNTHRLLVTGERVQYVEKEYQSISKEMMSFRELFFASLPFGFLLWGVRTMLNEKRLKKRRSRRSVCRK